MASIPVPYIGTGSNSQVVLGHYGVAQKSGASVSIAAAGILASIRWAPTVSTYFCIPMRIKAGWIVTAQITTATPMDLSAIVHRGFTTDFTTASTAISLSSNTNFMRSGFMRPSLMGANGPRICTTAVMSGNVSTADAAPFAITVWPGVVSTNATGTVATVVLGMAGAMQTVYEWTALGQHPLVLSNNEGVILEEFTAGTTGGSVAWYDQWEWAETLVF
jgi:hypothetical protein